MNNPTVHETSINGVGRKVSEDDEFPIVNDDDLDQNISASQEPPAWMDNTGGLSITTASLFIIGEMAGSGVLALPKAIADISWTGLGLLIVFAILASYTGTILGRCWIILQERFPEYRHHTRYPYPSIGFRAYGKPGRIAVSLALNITLFGVGTVYIILAAQLLQDLINSFAIKISYCYWMLVIGAFVTPFTWFGSPKNMWPIAIGAMSTTAVACILIMIKLYLVQPKIVHREYTETGFKSACLALGTILFAFGIHPTFPTVQHDMQKPKDFHNAVIFGYIGVLLMYFPVAAYGYIVFGVRVTDNILTLMAKVDSGPILNAVQVMLMVHLLFGFVIAINPVLQEMEQLFNIKLKFGWKRVVLRTLLVALIILVAESVPRFGAILSLIGGSTITFLCYICPCLFYSKLCSTGDHPLPFYQHFLHAEIIIVATFIGSAATYSALETIISPNTFILPCYADGMKPN